MRIHSVKTTNYHNTFIEVAGDCPAASAEAPPEKGDRKTIANLQFELINEHPHQLTSDDVVFHVFAMRNAIPEGEMDAERAQFFSKGQACLRASPLAKRYGWGIHHDADGKVSLVAMESDRYRELAADPNLTHVKAMRSTRG